MIATDFSERHNLSFNCVVVCIPAQYPWHFYLSTLRFKQGVIKIMALNITTYVDILKMLRNIKTTKQEMAMVW
jgi:hypothetical protein